MNWIVVHFDYGGHYSKRGDNVKWIARVDEIYTLRTKTLVEEVTYCWLVDQICKKIKKNADATKLKLSYIPLAMEPKIPSYIWDDDDVVSYLVDVNKDQVRSVLHVEEMKDVQGYEQILREDRGSEVELSNEELLSNGGAGEMTFQPGETLGRYEMVDYVVGDGENVCSEQLPNVDTSGICGTNEVGAGVEEDQCVNHEWEDGMDLMVGKEFESKQAMQDVVLKGSLRNCFEFATIKSECKLYVLKCREFKNGCKWFVRAGKCKNSNCFSIRTYNKMHTCIRTTTNTSKNRRKGTPRLVSSLLQEDYPSLIDTPSPKSLVGLVEERFGVKISYSTALRGKKQAVKDMRGSPHEKVSQPFSPSTT